MGTEVLIAAVAGGVAFFVWGFVSWVVLPWHNVTYTAFSNEDEIVGAIVKNAPTSGIYGIPKPGCGAKGMTPEAKKAMQEAAMARMKSGPMVTAVVTREGMDGMAAFMLRGFLLGVIGCGLAAWLLAKTAIVGTVDKALFVMLVAMVGSLVTHGQNWNWHRYPTKFTVVNLLDAAVGWFLAGIAIALVM